MRKKSGVLLIFVLLSLTIQSSSAMASILASISVSVENKEALQRGAKLYMNYCSGCHSLKYMRYDRMAEDLGLTDFTGKINKNLLNNLMFTQASVYDPIQIAMPTEDAQQWFGVVPPDLSLSAKERGASWIFQYLKNFYNDDSRPFGVNNLLVPNVAMPNVLEPLMGQMQLITNHESHTYTLFLAKPGELLPAEFDQALQDLVTFLVYVGEPAQLVRYKIGIFVIIFLAALFIIVSCLKNAYWRDLKK